MESSSPDSVFAGYEALSERQIRLLHLQPRGDQPAPTVQASPQPGATEITCSFSLTNLDDPVPFEALSYTWGDPGAKIPITVDGEQVKITENLGAALRHLRLDDKPRTIWVDALCINQLDSRERHDQVAAMRYVYERATGVVVFLGEAWDGHEIAVEFLELMDQNDYHYEPDMDPHVTVRGLDTNSDRLREEIIHFFMLPWWERIWVIQEYVLARSVTFQVGSRLVAALAAQRAFDRLRGHYWTCCAGNAAVHAPSPAHGVSLLDAIKRIDGIASMRRLQRYWTMVEALAMSRTRKAFDARDKIYGLMGLHFRREMSDVVPDYDVSPERVYTSFATRHMTETGTLAVLSHAGQLNRGGLDVPSYTPDWTAPMSAFEHTDYLSRGGASILYEASGQRTAQLRVLDDGAILLKGLLVGSISAVGAVHNADSSPLAMLDDCLQTMAGNSADITEESHTTGVETPLESKHLPKQDTAGTGATGTDNERFWRTLCGDIGATWEDGAFYTREAEPGETAVNYPAWRAWISVGQPSGLAPGSVAAGFGRTVQINTTGRKFVMINGGLIGFAPDTCQGGDVVAVLYGGRTPFVLRLVGETLRGEARYRLIGDAYIDGIMHGEALDGSLGSTEMDFLIC